MSKRWTLHPVSPANEDSYLPSGPTAYSGRTMESKRNTIISGSSTSILARYDLMNVDLPNPFVPMMEMS